eukprot:403354495
MVNSFLLSVYLKTFILKRNNPRITWRLDLNSQYQVVEKIKRSNSLTFVSSFLVNIPDLNALMHLPDLLTVIYEKFFIDRRLIQNFGFIPEIILKNHVQEGIFFDNDFDQFELARKFKLFSAISDEQRLKFAYLTNEMVFRNDYSNCIIDNLFNSLEDNVVCCSVVRISKYCSINNFNIGILDKIFKRSEYLTLDFNTQKQLKQSRNAAIYPKVFKLIIEDEYENHNNIEHLLRKFPNLRDLYISKLFLDEYTFFDKFERYFRHDDSQNVQEFRAKLYFRPTTSQDQLFRGNFNDMMNDLNYLFLIIVGMDVPRIKLEITIFCNTSFLEPKQNQGFFSLLGNYQYTTQFVNLTKQQRVSSVDCVLYLTVDKDRERERLYSLKFQYVKKEDSLTHSIVEEMNTKQIK